MVEFSQRVLCCSVSSLLCLLDSPRPCPVPLPPFYLFGKVIGTCRGARLLQGEGLQPHRRERHFKTVILTHTHTIKNKLIQCKTQKMFLLVTL